MGGAAVIAEVMGPQAAMAKAEFTVKVLNKCFMLIMSSVIQILLNIKLTLSYFICRIDIFKRKTDLNRTANPIWISSVSRLSELGFNTK